MITGIHHVAIICSNYSNSKEFYTKILGMNVIAENYRAEKDSYKLDLLSPDGKRIELFSMPDAPERLTMPEAKGLRHLAFSVISIEAAVKHLELHDIKVEPVRIDEYTDRKYTFFRDPDDLPLELYEE